MRILRILRRAANATGWILAGLGLAVLCHDAVKTLVGGGLSVTDAGSLWHALHAGSLQQAEPAVARYLSPFLWHPVITTILLWPAALVIGVPGALLAFAARRRDGGRGSLFRG